MRAVEEATKATPEAAAVAPFLALPSAPPPSSLLRPFSVSSSSSSPSSSSLDALAGAAVIDEVVCVTTAVADASIDWTQMVSAADHKRLLRLLADEEAISLYKKTLALEPNNKTAQQGLKKLEKRQKRSS